MASIARIETDNGFALVGKGFKVEITNDGRFFTIYDAQERPMGTIIRPMVIGGERRWNVYRTDGSRIAGGVGPRYCFARFIDAQKG